LYDAQEPANLGTATRAYGGHGQGAVMGGRVFVTVGTTRFDALVDAMCSPEVRAPPLPGLWGAWRCLLCERRR
jgi:hypothetical protein